MEEQKKQGGKKPGQKFKSLLVWDILQKRTDENHAIQLKEIVEHLKMYGITAERHSIKRDIDDMGEVPGGRRGPSQSASLTALPMGEPL